MFLFYFFLFFCETDHKKHPLFCDPFHKNIKLLQICELHQ
ncbi:hypothetical protein appser12_12720 [Actinobacillus pleuropneumoniae serovar 12 str. 1096]|nr:hypothetical protein appser12_12720 [Actinobacillus pleuropneumoniae serovar 12 str. 1096]